MFKHNLKYNLKTLFKNKALIFWTYLFPIILGTFFYLAFHDIEKNETFKAIPIAIIENEEWQENNIWQSTIKSLSEEKDNKVFNTTYKNIAEAKKDLEKGDIIGYVLLEENIPKVIIKTNGTSATILKSIIEEINSKINIIEDYIELKVKEKITNEGYENINKINYEEIAREALGMLEIENNIKDITSDNMSYTMIEYYTLIAMAALYGGILGMVSLNKCLANMGSLGKRVSISPTKKGTIILSSAVSSYIAQIIGIALLFLYTIFVLKVDYGTNLALVILLALIGSLTGLSMGIALSSILKTNENTKLGIIIAITMAGCFLSGMMGITMKYVIDKNVPIINMINPAALITDGFYLLYRYDTLNRYWINIISLLIITSILILISIKALRRNKYDSI